MSKPRLQQQQLPQATTLVLNKTSGRAAINFAGMNNETEQLRVERVLNKSVTINNEQRALGVACNAFTGLNSIDHAYENVKFELRHSKQLLLQKFFHSAERQYAVYENLCLGCGYGVFDASGRLCNFCACLVHGVRPTAEEHVSNRALENIYANVCEKCAGIYGCGEDDTECLCTHRDNITSDKHFISETCENVERVKVNTPTQVPLVKLSKSKSFGKRDKRNIFHGLIGSLKRHKTPIPTQPVQIVHHVEGFEHVFHTQDTFDLQRICELKRHQQNSCSDQHIYGRLKTHEENVSSASTSNLPTETHDLLLQTASVDDLRHDHVVVRTNKAGNPSAIRSFIARPRLLRSRSQKSTIPQPHKQALYLPDSVCAWMTSLRREQHNYRSFGVAVDDELIALCQPKSIPARNSPIYYATNDCGYQSESYLAPAPANNNKKTDSFSDNSVNSSKSGIIAEVELEECVTLRRKPNSGQLERQQRETLTKQLELFAEMATPADRMVLEFKQNLIVKQMQQQQQQQHGQAASSTGSEHEQQQQQQQLRSKRQAIYLKLDDTLNNNETITNNNNNNNNNNQKNTNHCDAQVNWAHNNNETAMLPPSEKVNAAVAQTVPQNALSKCSEKGLLLLSDSSRALARQAYTTAHKRCGVYERDSEFVNDILNAFDTFLQRDEFADVVNNSSRQVATTAYRSRESLSTNARHSDLVENCAVTAQEVSISCDPSTELMVTPEGVRKNQAGNTKTTQLQLMSGSGTTAQIYDVAQLFNNLVLLSLGLNRTVIYYDKPLLAFLRYIYNNSKHKKSCMNYTLSEFTSARLLRKFGRFQAYCQRAVRNLNSTEMVVNAERDSVSNTVPATRENIHNNNNNHNNNNDNNNSNVQVVVRFLEIQEVENTSPLASVQVSQMQKPVEQTAGLNYHTKGATQGDLALESQNSALTQCCEDKQIDKFNNGQKKVDKLQRPQVPLRNPKTTLTTITNTTATNNNKNNYENTSFTNKVHESQTVSSQISKNNNEMTVPTTNNMNESEKSVAQNSFAEHVKEEEDIYQPIWKFKTVGEAQERYHIDADYYELGSELNCGLSVSRVSISQSLLSDDSAIVPSLLISQHVDDHGEWETDDEFMFTTGQQANTEILDVCSLHSSTVRSTRSNSSAATTTTTGSTVTSFGSSMATLPSATSASLTHQLLRNIGIFYSLTNKKLRAIKYDYDRVQASTYFACPLTCKNANAQNSNDSGIGKSLLERSPVPPPRTTSKGCAKISALSESGSQPVKALPSILPDSVQAWKFMLLDVNYTEDEEDMVSVSHLSAVGVLQ